MKGQKEWTLNAKIFIQDNQDGLKIYNQYRTLCQKSYSSKTDSNRNVGKCEFRADSPSYLLKPWKVEIYRQIPRIEMYHDLISSSFVDMLSELSYDNLVRKAKNKVLY